MKKTIALLMIAALALTALAGCNGGGGGSSEPPAAPPVSDAGGASETPAAPAAPVEPDAGGAGEVPLASEVPAEPAAGDWGEGQLISVVSREDGSGTRGAFIELLGIQVRGDDGSSTDMTTREATIADGTNVMMTNIAGDPYAIGYISLGSLNSTVKALDIDGVKATAANVENGTYKVQRPFKIAWQGEAGGLAGDFIGFIFSKEGQDIVADRGYIAIDESAPAYSGDRPSGKLVINGSSSVHPLMERLVEAYQAINGGADIELHQTDSSAGMTAAMNGSCDIGMASRDLRESEEEELSHATIAIDGIAVIVNNDNPRSGLTSEQVKDIFIGDITEWGGAK